MQLEIHGEASVVTITATPDSDDRIEFGKAKFTRNTASFVLPRGYDLADTHPDVLALAAIVSFSPWIGKTAHLPFPVSEHFAHEIQEALKIDVPNRSNSIELREAVTDARPGLSFSAGVDSFACLEIMPSDTVAVFSHRSPSPSGARSLYRDDAPMHAISAMEKRGADVIAVETDIEWIRNPVGFGVDPAPAVPLLLMADHLRLDAIAFGTIAEAAYRTGTRSFIDFPQRPIFTKWQRAFKAASLDYYDCVAPMSELCTTLITKNSKYGDLAQSCVRGLPGAPCLRCVKCFRKSLIESSMTGHWNSFESIGSMAAERAVTNYLAEAPIRLEVVIASALRAYNGNDPLLKALVRRTGADKFDYSFTSGWYDPGMDAMIPAKYREATKRRALEYLEPMTPAQEVAFTNFDIDANLNWLISEGRVAEFRGALRYNSDAVAMRAAR